MADPTTPDNLPQVLGKARGQIDDFAFAVNQQFDSIDENIRSLMGTLTELSIGISATADQVDKNLGLVVRSTSDAVVALADSLSKLGGPSTPSAGASGGQSDLETGLQTFGLAATGMSLMSVGMAIPGVGVWIAALSGLAAVLSIVIKRVQESGDEISSGLDQAFGQDMAKIIDEQIEGLEVLIEAWKEHSKELVGQSIVPDMVNEIAQWFGKLDPLMVKPVQEMGGEVENAFRGMGDRVASSIGNMVKSGKVNFDSLRGAARSLLQDLQSMLINQLIVSPIRSGLNSFITNAFQTRASGGDVTGGRPFLVGEQGPELFVPKTSGVIRPTGRIRDRTEATLNFNIDARGADRARIAQMENALITHIKSTPSIAIAAVNNFNARRR